MHVIRLLRRDSSLLEGPQFTELLLHLYQLSLLSSADVRKIQVVDSSKQVDCLLDTLEATSRLLDPHDFSFKVVQVLRKANYTSLANRVATELQSRQDDQDTVDGGSRSFTGSSGILYPPNMPSHASSNVDHSVSASSGIFSGESTSNSYQSRSSAVLDTYRQEYSKKSLDLGKLESALHDIFIERALADLPTMQTRTARYARLLKNVWTMVAEYYAQASQAFRCLELYGLSLLRYSWKPELRKISTVSGVYRLRIAPHLTDASVVLVDMGFAEQPDGSFLLTGAIDRERTMEVAFQCFLMVVHCRRMCLINLRYSTNGSVDSAIGKSKRSSITSQVSSSIGRDSGFSGESMYQNMSEHRDSRDNSRDYRDVFSSSKNSNSGTRRAAIESTDSSSYYSNISRDSMTRDSNIRSNQNRNTSSSRAPSSLASRVSAMSMVADEQQSRSSAVPVDQSTVDTITKFMEGIPDEGLSTLLCMPQASSSFLSSRQQSQGQGQTSGDRIKSHSIPTPAPSSDMPTTTKRNASTSAVASSTDRSFKETTI